MVGTAQAKGPFLHRRASLDGRLGRPNWLGVVWTLAPMSTPSLIGEAAHGAQSSGSRSAKKSRDCLRPAIPPRTRCRFGRITPPLSSHATSPGEYGHLVGDRRAGAEDAIPIFDLEAGTVRIAEGQQRPILVVGTDQLLPYVESAQFICSSDHAERPPRSASDRSAPASSPAQVRTRASATGSSTPKRSKSAL